MGTEQTDPMRPPPTQSRPPPAPGAPPASPGDTMTIDVLPDLRISEYIQKIKQQRPRQLTLVGVGRDVGRAAWLALVLERDHRFRRLMLDLDRVPGPNGLDVGRLTIVLEALLTRSTEGRRFY